MGQSLENITQFALAVRTKDLKNLKGDRRLSERYLTHSTHTLQKSLFIVLCVLAEVFISKE